MKISLKENQGTVNANAEWGGLAFGKPSGDVSANLCKLEELSLVEIGVNGLFH